MTDQNNIRNPAENRIAYLQSGYAVACYDMKLSVPAVSIQDNKLSVAQIPLSESASQDEPDVLFEKSRFLIENAVIAVFSGIESEKRYLKSKDTVIDRSLIKKIRNRLEPLTRTARELAAYQNFLHIRAQDYIRDPLVWQKIKDLAREIFKKRELNGNQVRSIIRDSFARSFEKWKKRQNKP